MQRIIHKLTRAQYDASTPVASEFYVIQDTGELYKGSQKYRIGYYEFMNVGMITPPTKTTYTPGEVFDPTGMTIGANWGDIGSGTIAKTFPVSNYTYDSSPMVLGRTSIWVRCIFGGQTREMTVPVTVRKIEVTIPTLKSTPVWTGGTITPEWNDYDSSKMTLTGETSGVDSKSYTATFSLNNTETYSWSDGTITDKPVTWSISKRNLTVPTLSGTYTYTGSPQNVKVNNFDDDYMTQGGDASGTNVGTYTVTWDLKYPANTYWGSNPSDVAQKSADWNIAKGKNNVSVSPTSHSWSDNVAYDFTITNPTGGQLTAKSSNTTNFVVPTDPLTSNTLTVTAQGRTSSQKTGTITITSGETANYAAGTCTISCTLTATCVAGDSLILLSNGNTKRIDELTYDDELVVWNFYSGDYDVSKPMMIMHHGTEKEYMKLNFSDGTTLKVIISHELFDIEDKKWVDISKYNVEECVGREYAKYAEDGVDSVTLVSYEMISGPVESYSVQTAIYANAIIEGLFTFTVQEYEGMYDIFPIGSDMKYDEESMNKDIAKYGLYTPEDFINVGLSEEMFYAADGAHFKILVGRSVLTFEQIVRLINDYLIEATKADFVIKKED